MPAAQEAVSDEAIELLRDAVYYDDAPTESPEDLRSTVRVAVEGEISRVYPGLIDVGPENFEVALIDVAVGEEWRAMWVPT